MRYFDHYSDHYGDLKIDKKFSLIEIFFFQSFWHFGTLTKLADEILLAIRNVEKVTEQRF